jgi:hypothetical protein
VKGKQDKSVAKITQVSESQQGHMFLFLLTLEFQIPSAVANALRPAMADKCSEKLSW